MSVFLSRYGEWVGLGAVLVGALWGQHWAPAYGLGLAVYGLIGAIYGQILVKWKIEENGKKLLGKIAMAVGALWFVASLLGAGRAP